MEIVGKISKGGDFSGLVKGKSKLRFGVKGFPGGSGVKNLPANAGAAGDIGSIPGWGRSSEEEMATHSSILAGIILWTEEPGRLQFMQSQRVGHC